MIVLRIGICLGAKPCAHFIQFLRGIEGIISMALLNQLLRILTIQIFSFTLTIGSILSSMMDTFIGFKTAPFQGFKNIFFCSGNKPALVCVFNAQYKFSSLLPGK